MTPIETVDDTDKTNSFFDFTDKDWLMTPIKTG